MTAIRKLRGVRPTDRFSIVDIVGMRVLVQSAFEETSTLSARGGTGALQRAATPFSMVRACHPGAILLLTLAITALPPPLCISD
jgi:hypothetical protein